MLGPEVRYIIDHSERGRGVIDRVDMPLYRAIEGFLLTIVEVYLDYFMCKYGAL